MCRDGDQRELAQAAAARGASGRSSTDRLSIRSTPDRIASSARSASTRNTRAVTPWVMSIKDDGWPGC